MSNLFSSGGAGNVGFSGETQQSLKFNDDESQYLSWTPAAAGNRKTWTWSGWVKRGNLGVTVSLMDALQTSGTDWTRFHFNSSNQLAFAVEISNSNVFQFVTTQVFRDTSAWYHIVAAYDSTQATSTDRFKLYVNGEQITDFGTETYGAQNTDSHINSTIEHNIGAVNSGIWFFDGYMSDINFIDGQALDASSFGQFTNGYWEKKDYAGSYGQNGFHLTFQDDVVSEGFNTVTYRGNGGTQSISGLGFEPDFVWIKNRTTAYDHVLTDSVRGATKTLESNNTDAEGTEVQDLSQFSSDGFTVGTNARVNGSGEQHVAWAWDAGSGSPVSNTDGSITSTVKANPDYGFSIVSYAGTGANATVGHGLSSAPDMVIIKNRNGTARDWGVYHSGNTASPATQRLLLSSTAATDTNSGYWNNTLPSTTVFSLGGNPNVNPSSTDMIAYCFAEVAGYSSIGSYSGTGASGNAITTGFRPAFVMVKRSNNTGNWVIWDTTRTPQSGTIQGSYISANSSDGEESPSGSNDIEFTDTGFTLQDNGIYSNSSGDTFIYMAFADTREASFWKDVSGQGNHWTPNNLDYRDSLIDSPANNFATLNPLSTTAGTYTEGNTRYVGASSWRRSNSTMAVSSGKWYWEYCILNDPYSVRATNSAYNAAGFGVSTAFNSTVEHALVTDALVYTDSGYYKNFSGSYTSGAANALTSTGDIIGFAVDLDANTFTIYKNNVSEASGSIGMTTGTEITPILLSHSDPYGKMQINVGQDSTFSGNTTAGGNTDANGIGDFKYAPPSGYLALCTANLPTPSIVDGSEHFNTVLYTGTGATQSITGVNHQPDLVWIKTRNTASQHVLTDSVRGVSKQLFSSLTNGETTEAGKGVTSFDSDGFTLGTELSVTGSTNNGTYTYASWNWKAGGTAVSNTDGSITSQVSANVDAGFSVVSWTGTGANATVGHGLNSAPEMIIPKDRDSGNSWSIYHSAIGAGKYMNLNETISAQTNSAVWQGVEPTSSVFSIGTSGNINQSGDDFIAYCFHSVEGFSKAGSYEANNSTDGPFVYCGFRPAFVIMKGADYAVDWFMFDAQRDVDNVVREVLYSNSSSAESSGDSVDFLSNGFKVRNSGAGGLNYTGTYIFLAFAENPFKYANAR